MFVHYQWGVVHPWHGTVANLWGRHKDFTEFNETLKIHISWMDYPFLSKLWMFIAKKYSTFNEFIFFSEYSVLLKCYKSRKNVINLHLVYLYALSSFEKVRKNKRKHETSRLPFVYFWAQNVLFSQQIWFCNLLTDFYSFCSILLLRTWPSIFV